MPYSSISKINPALRGIKPSITLAQANLIARWADKITGVDSPWAVAIAQFKKLYKVVNGKWVRKKKEQNMKDKKDQKLLEQTKQKEEDKDNKEYYDAVEPLYPYVHGATSFDELDEMEKLDEFVDQVKLDARRIPPMVNNILFKDENKNTKVSMISALAEQFVKRAKELLGQLKEIVTKGKATNSNSKDVKSLFFWKEKNGQYRWFAIYSNMFRDEDSPPEIISQTSQKRFVKMVDDGEVPMPKLMHWHIPGTVYGQADWLAFDTDNGFALASGYILEGHEKEVECIMKMRVEDMGVSHGMPSASLKYAEDKKGIIIEHITEEISDLPLKYAANKLTGFQILNKEKEMSIPDEKKQYLIDVGLGEDQIKELEANIGEKAKTAIDTQLEFKDAEKKSEAKESKVDTTEKESEVSEEVAEKKQEETTEASAETENQFSKDVTEAVLKLADAVKAINDRLQTIESVVEKQEEEEKKEIDLTPAASIAAIVARKLSVIGTKEAQVHGNTSLAQGKPEETEADESLSYIMNSGNSLLDKTVTNICTGKGIKEKGE